MGGAARGVDGVGDGGWGGAPRARRCRAGEMKGAERRMTDGVQTQPVSGFVRCASRAASVQRSCRFRQRINCDITGPAPHTLLTCHRPPPPPPTPTTHPPTTTTSRCSGMPPPPTHTHTTVVLAACFPPPPPKKKKEEKKEGKKKEHLCTEEPYTSTSSPLVFSLSYGVD